MNISELGSIAAIVNVILFALFSLIDRWDQMIKKGGSILPKISLIFMILAILSAGFSFIASRYISPPSGVISIKDQRDKLTSGEMLPFDYEEITITKDKAVGLDLGRLKAMETATNKQYMAIIHVEDCTIAYLYTGDHPTSNTKNKMHPGDSIILYSLTAMKQFKAIGIDGTATLAVNYLQGPAK